MLSYKICMKLKDADWPQNKRSETGVYFWCENNGELGKGREQGTKRIQHRDFLDEWGFTWDKLCDCPTLEELITACGTKFLMIHHDMMGEGANDYEWSAVEAKPGEIGMFEYGDSPIDAVANLWLELNKEKDA